MTPTRVRLLLLMAALFALAPLAVWACDTPVYRYALYNWRRAPYQVLYFHDGQIPEEAAAVNQLVRNLANPSGESANLELLTVDVSQPDQLEDLPREYRAAFEQARQEHFPLHMVFTPPLLDAPSGSVLFAGQLTAADVESMCHSPVREQLIKALHDGHAGVLLRLEGKDPAQTKRVDEAIAEVVQRAAAGKIAGNPASVDALVPNTETETSPVELDVAVVHLKRDDPNEAWLLKTLLSAEPDLYEFDEPMVFASYGRARMTLPYIGKGINADNLEEVVQFVSGACSCEVQAQVPGFYLVTRWNWESSAENLARLVGTEEGNEQLLKGSALPSLVPELEEPAADQAGTEEPQDEPPVQLASAAQTPTETAAETGQAPSEERGRVPELAPKPDPEAIQSLMSQPAEEAEEEPSFASRLVNYSAIGVGLLFLVLAVVSGIMLRPKGDD